MTIKLFRAHPWIRVLLVFGCCWLAGCATKPVVVNSPQAQLPTEEHAGYNWWYARFRMGWPKDAEPAWHIDALIAHEVIKPVLNEFQDHVFLWRFHRRAAREGGHQFSFIFYSDPSTALEIYRSIEASDGVSELLADGTVEGLLFDDTSKSERPMIEDTSDRGWNEIVQKSWPYFIMGVSQMWLDMINRLVIFNADKPDSKKELFRHIHDGITQLWKYDGGHAFFHHLNALFAYKAVQIIERRSMTY